MNNENSVDGYVPPQQGNEGDAEAGQNYYYYYEMPDGTIGYITADEYNGMYSPVDQQETEEAGPQPAGYVEPTYGQGTAYAWSQEQYVDPSQTHAYYTNESSVDTNNNHNSGACYTYDTRDACGDNNGVPSQQQQKPLYPQQVIYVEPPGAQQPSGEANTGADAMTAAPQPALPHEQAEGGWFVPPDTFDTLCKSNGTQKWHTSLGKSCCKEPCFCLGACLAPWCVVAAHRERLLQKDLKPYRCCAGVCGRVDNCECCGETPRCGLFWEVLFCLPCACHANRYMLMQRYNLERSCWDSTVLSCGCFCAPCRHCCKCTCWFPESVWNCLYVVTYSCMLTQHHRELDAHEKAND